MPDFMRITTNQEMRKIDQIAQDEFDIDANILMENAGRAAVQVLFDVYPHAGKQKEILVFAGKGNNAGDAFVVARRLLCLDRKVRVFLLVDPKQYKGSTKKNYEILTHMKAKMLQLEAVSDLNAFFERSQGPFVAIDGILGTGLKGNLEGIFYDVVECINKNVTNIVSLDIPTGVDGDSGAVNGASILSTLTLSFGFPKLGHFLPPGASRRGKLVNVDISLPPQYRKEGSMFLLRPHPMAKLLEVRDRYGHKNSFGHCLLIGGSIGTCGAISLASRACHRIGTGLVSVATWSDTYQMLSTRLVDETMVLPVQLNHPEVAQEVIGKYSSIVIGPGLGMRKEGKRLMDELLSTFEGPLVIDADGLNLISEYDFHDLLVKRSAPTVLTPHVGEMARLLKMDKEDILKAPVDAIKRAVDKTFSVVVLKGASTLIGSTEERIYLNHYPNDGMATAGSGDVLAGMIGGLLGQNMNDFDAAQLGVFLHSFAGGFASKKYGHRSMCASDIIKNIGNAFEKIKSYSDPSFPEEGRANLL